MALKTLKKKIDRGNQYLFERLTGVSGSEKGYEYQVATQHIDAYKKDIENLLKRMSEFLEPNPNVRARLHAASAISKLSGDDKHYSYPVAEKDLADSFAQFGRDFTPQCDFATALIQSGEAFKMIADAKCQAVEETKGGFVAPLTDTLRSDLKEIAQLRKKTEEKRLTYDAKKRQFDKHNLSINDLNEAKEQFEASMSNSWCAMQSFLGSNVEHIQLLQHFVNSQLSFHQTTTRILNDLQNELELRLRNAQQNKNNTTSNSMDGYNRNDATSPGIQRKPKYDNTIQATPVCCGLYNFAAENAAELSFCKGDVIQLLDRVDENWFLGRLNGKEGHFPTNYVEVLVPLPEA